MLRLLLFFSLVFQALSASSLEEKIISELAPALYGKSQAKPILVLLGGYVASGKTTLSQALREKYGFTIFSLNAIRQAMLNEGIDIRNDKQQERKVLLELYPKLLAPCVANRQDIVIDANANRQGIQEALQFLQTHSGSEAYAVVKIHLTASEQILRARINQRAQRADLHQGTEQDLDYELSTPSKAIYPEDYDLVINTEEVSLLDEMAIVESYFQAKHVDR